MTKFLSFLFMAIFACGSARSQERFTKRIQATGGKGTVVLHQSSVISDLVDGVKPEPARKEPTSGTSSDGKNRLTQSNEESNTSAGGMITGKRVRVNGYRIQVYSGGNSREAKSRAEAMERRVRELFPDLSVYTRFDSPRWICHLGDFTSREQALEVLGELRKEGGFKEAIIVKSKVYTYVY